MKNVLFIGVTEYDLAKNLHLKEKFEGLSKQIKPYVLAKGKPFHKSVWGAEFYLLRPKFFWLQAPIFAFWLCSQKKIDTIVVQGPLLEGLLGVVLKKVFHKEFIVELHGDWEERLPSFRGVLTFFAKNVLKNADKIRAVANYLVLKAEKYASSKPYFVFPTFTDLNDFLAEKDIQFNSEILFVGRNDRVKGIPYLLEAFTMVFNEFPNFRLVLVGEGLDQNFQFPISNFQFKEMIDLRGKVSLKEIRDIMKNCYCLVSPSITEGLPRVILEAMALAKPVVASRVGGIPDLIQDGENGFLFEVGNVRELAEKLRILLSNKPMAIEMGGRGREFVQSQFSNEKYISNYLSMIEEGRTSNI